MTPCRRLSLQCAIVFAVAACGVQPVQNPNAEPVTVGPAPDPVPSSGLAVQQPGAPPPPETLAELVRLSPCDILPETAQVVGSLAHDDGYPVFRRGEIMFDTLSPRRVPDFYVVQALTGGNTYENEVHDCQRLVLEEGEELSFGPLVGLLPLDSAMSLVDSDFAAGVVVGTVYNWGDSTGAALRYPDLRIGHGWNCLWIRHDGGSTWRAALTPNASQACYDRPPPGPADYTLDVQRAHHQATIPKTARWGWNATRAVHTMGIRCGSAWCWVGPENFFGQDSVHLGGHAATIPGYLDEQHLSMPDGKGWVTPGPVAVLTPTAVFYNLSELQRLIPDLDWFGFLSSIPVATIEIPDWPGRATPEPYATLWGVAQHPVRYQRPVQVGLRVGQGALTSTFRNSVGRLGRSVAPIRTSNVSHAAIGAVRWRWHDTANSLSLWSACGERGMDCCDTR